MTLVQRHRTTESNCGTVQESHVDPSEIRAILDVKQPTTALAETCVCGKTLSEGKKKLLWLVRLTHTHRILRDVRADFDVHHKYLHLSEEEEAALSEIPLHTEWRRVWKHTQLARYLAGRVGLAH